MPDLPICNKCNNNCIMCSNPDDIGTKDPGLFSLTNLLKRIERFHRGEQEFLDNYRDAFSITGGEPTLSPHLFSVVEKINDFFPKMRIICLSNGRMFSYAGYAKSFFQLPADLELNISIHGHNAALHDKITRSPGSFRQMVTGLENIFRFRKPGQLIGIRVIIHRLNYKFLREIIEFIKKNFPQVSRLVFIFFEIEGQACKNLKRVKLTYTELLPYASGIYNLIPYFSEVRFYHFPLCTLPAEFFPYVWRTLPEFEVSFPAICKKCNLKALCLGVHKGYLEHIGEFEFKPITKKTEIKKSTNYHHPVVR